MITLEAIDYVINMTGAEFSDVRIALIDADGDVDRAIELIKERKQFRKFDKEHNDSEFESEAEEVFKDFQDKFTKSASKTFGNLQGSVEDIIEAIKEIFRKGNARKLLIEKNGETVLQLSLTASIVAAIAAPIAAVLGLGVAYSNSYKFLIMMEDGTSIDVEEYIKSKTKSSKNDSSDGEEEQTIIDEDEEDK
ncbi:MULTISPECIES: DUF4342 domain-containing protein [Peptoniphilus]|uniref:DUF4342 domain-containing protein n=1 Tax=Peptoniphilus TaxID=162289 RepID=UPI0003B8861C|nr:MULTISPECIES: DUF4342 domain-containing protein [Peptoniphilus]ERT64926.1 PF14242 domain protein [Peptoniphilus sp. BV3AC2]MDK8275639.1 DUF4342 domain-containing protein [Peptoniphilus duerdenii]